MKNFNQRGGFGDRKSGGFNDRKGGGFDRKGPSSFGDRRDSGGRDFNRGGGRDFARPAMHQATCAQCGQSCEVPFKPTGDRPVYCSNCFKGKDANSSPRRPENRDFAKPSFSARGNSGNADGASRGDSSNKQLELLNEKLDRILSALDLFSVSKPAVKKEIAKIAIPENKKVVLKAKTAASKNKIIQKGKRK